MLRVYWRLTEQNGTQRWRAFRASIAGDDICSLRGLRTTEYAGVLYTDLQSRGAIGRQKYP